jgi:hypothetical protein
MDRVQNMGLPRDMTQRISLARTDNIPRRSRVEAARKAIYVQNFAINSVVVENLLKEDSLVPTAVSCFSYSVALRLINYRYLHRMHSQTNWLRSTSIYLIHSWLTYCMK